MKEAHLSSDDSAIAPQRDFVLHAKDIPDTGHHDQQQNGGAHFVVDDAQLLFSGHYSKAGNDLVISADGRDFVVHDYFRGEARAPIYAPDGSSLSGDVVSALAGHTSFAQAGDPAPAADTSIGHVAKLTGAAHVIRNGVTVELNVGDKVFKSDVVEAGKDAALGIVFVDGTAFSLGSNARMVLNDMVYDPNGSSNSSFLSLVQGSITFVAGQTAKNGSMKIDTPVATMGIRGTAVFVDISADNGPTKFSVLVEPGNHVGFYELFDKYTGEKIGEVGTAGINLIVQFSGFKELSITQQAKTPADLAAEQALIQQVFSMAFSKLNDANPKLNFGSIGSGVSPDGTEFFYPFVLQAPSLLKLTSLTGPSGEGTGSSGPGISYDPPPIVKVTNASTTQTGGAGVTNVVINETAAPGSFFIADHVTIIDPSVGTPPFFDIAVKYVPNTGFFVSVVDPAFQAKPGYALPFTLASLVSIDKLTGEITYNHNFEFLSQGETVVYTFQFDAYGGPSGFDEANHAPYTVVATITLTIVGVNDPPVIQNPTSQNSQISLAQDPGVQLAASQLPGGSAQQTNGDWVVDANTYTFTDPDFNDSHTIGATFDAAHSSLGAFSVKYANTPLGTFSVDATQVDSSGSGFGGSVVVNATPLHETFNGATGSFAWTLTLNPDQIAYIDSLPAGTQLTETFDVTVTDNNGAVATQVVTIDLPMTDTWTGAAGDGKWSTAGNWSEGVPGPISVVDIAPGTATTVTLAADDTIFSLDTNSHTTLDINSGTTLTIAGQATSTLSGSIVNNGTILVSSQLLNDAGATISDGKFTFGGTTYFVGTAATIDLTNPATTAIGTAGFQAGDIITVDGQVLDVVAFGATGPNQINVTDSVTDLLAKIDGLSGGSDSRVVDGQLLLNSGPTENLTITSSDSAALAALGLAGGVTTSAGTFEVTASATIDDVAFTNNGTIKVDGSQALTLEGGTTVTGGTLNNAGTVKVETAGATLDGVAVHNTASGSLIQVDINVGPPSATTALLLTDGTSISGGKMSIGDVGILDVEKGAGAVSGADATLDNVSVTGTDAVIVSGTIVTPASLIEIGANGAATLLIDDNTSIANGAMTISNGATLDVETGATGSGATLDGVTVTGGGTIDVGATTAATLVLDDGTSIDGVTLSIGGEIEVKSGAGASLTNLTVETGGGASTALILVDSGSTLTLSDVTLSAVTLNGGTVDLNGSGNGSTVTAASTIENGTLQDGTLTVSGVTLTLSDEMLSGVTLTGGTVDLNGGGNGSTVTGDSTIENGTLQNGTLTVSGVTLTLSDEMLNGVTLTGGTVDLNGGGNGSTVTGASTIENGTLQDGTLTVSGVTLTLSDEMLNGVTLTGGTVDLNGGGNGSTVTGASTIENGTLQNGTLTVSGVTLTLSDEMLNGVTLTDGTVDLNGSGNGSTVTGASTIENGTLQDGTLTVSGVTLTLSDEMLSGVTLTGGTVDLNGGGNGSTVTAASTIENGTLQHGTLTVSRVTLTLSDEMLSGVTLTGGTVDLNGSGNGSTVTGASTIENGTLQDGTLTVSGVTLTLSDETLSGVTVTGGTVDLNGGGNGSTVTAASTIENGTLQHGTLTVSGVTLTLSDEMLSGVTLTGGTVDLNGSGYGSTVTGASTIENGTLQDGTLTVSGVTLTLSDETLSGVTLTGGTVDLNGGGNGSTVTAASTIENGTLQHGTLTVSGVTLTLSDEMLSGVTLTGGTVDLNGSGYGSTVTGASTIENGTLQDGTLTVSGVTLTLSDETLSGVTLTGGTVDLNGGANGSTVTAASTIENGTLQHGTLTVSGVTLTLSDEMLGGVTLTGGTVDLNGSGNGSTVTGASTIEDGTLQDGTLTVSGVTLTLSDETLSGVTLTGGTVDLNGGANGSTVTAASTIENGTLQHGTLTVSGVTLTLSDEMLGGVTLTGGTVDLNGSGNGSTVTGASTIEDGTLQDGTLTVSGVTLTLSDEMLSGVTLTGGTVDLNGGGNGSTVTAASTIENGTLQHGTLTVSGVTLTLSDEMLSGVTLTGGTVDLNGSGNGSTVTGASTIENGTLQHGTLTVSGVTLTLSDETLSGVTLTGGTVDLNGSGNGSTVTGASTIENDTLQHGTLTVSGVTLTLSDEMLSGVTLTGGTVDLNGAGNGSTVITASTIENGTLQDGTLTVSGVTLTLDNETASGVTFADTASGSTLSVDSTDVLMLEGGTTVTGGTLTNAGTVKVETTGATLDGVTVQNTGSGSLIQVDTGMGGPPPSLTTLLLDDGTTISGGMISIGDVGVVNIEKGADTITGADATFDDVAVTGTDEILTVTGAVVTPASLIEIGISSTATLLLDDGTSIQAGAMSIGSTGTLEIGGGAATTLSDLAIANNGIIQIDDSDIVKLNGVTITGGTIDDGSSSGAGGTIDVVGTSTIKGGSAAAALNYGTVKVESGQTLNFGNVKVAGTTFADPGTIKVQSGKTLTFDGTNAINGGRFAFGGGIAGGTNSAVPLTGTVLEDLTPAVALAGLTLTIVAQNGGALIPAADLAALGLTVVHDGSTGTLEVTGTYAAIEAALKDGLTYDPGGASSNTLKFSVTDSAGDTASRTYTVDTTGASPVVTVTDASGAVRNAGEIDVHSGTTTLNSDQVFNGGSTIVIDSGAILKLVDTGTHGGTFTLDGTLEVGANVGINGATVNMATDSNLTVDSGGFLLLNATTIDGTGTITDSGAIEVGTTSAIKGTSSVDAITLTGTGTVTVDADQTLTLDNVIASGVAFTDTASGATLTVDAGTALTLENGAVVTGGNLVNLGTLYVESSTGATLDGVNLTGGGALVVDLSPTPGTLLLDDGTTITGGTMSIGSVGLVDIELGSKGPGATLDDVTITGTDAVFTTSGAIVTPASLLEVGATSAATLVLDNGTSLAGGDLTVDALGTLEVGYGTAGAGATLNDVAFSNLGLVQIDSGATATFNVDSFTNSGTITLQDSITSPAEQKTALYLSVASGSLQNTGGIINDTGIASELFIQGNATVDGGTVNIGGGDINHASLLWNYDPTGSGAILTLDAAVTINVVGNAGLYSSSTNTAAGMQDWIDNYATIDTSASLASGSILYIQPSYFLNYGAINAGANLTVEVIATNGVYNAGTITALNGGAVDFEVSKLHNQVRTVVTGSVVDNDNTNGASAITAATRLVGTAGPGSNDLGTAIQDGSVLVVDGKTITFSAAQTNVTTDGSGNVTIGIGSGSTLTVQDVLNAIDGITGSAVPSTVSEGELILSYGGTTLTIGGGTGNALAALGLSTATTITHVGTINADGGTVTLETGNVVVNFGLLEATNGGVLDVKDATINNSGLVTSGGTLGILIDSTSQLLVDTATLKLNGGGDVSLQGGEIAAQPTNALVVSGSFVTLENVDNTIFGSGRIGDGTTSDLKLVNDAAGIIDATGTLILETGNTIANSGLLEATNGGTLDVRDAAITNNGAAPLGILVASGSYLEVDATAGLLKLNGSGTVTLNSGTIKGNGTTSETLQNVGNTITGAGTIGTGDSLLTLKNSAGGTIDATGKLVLDTGNAITNAGLLEATSGGTLDVQDASITNTGVGPLGILVASGGILEVDVGAGASNLLKLNGSGTVTLTGGTIEGNGTSSETLQNVNNTITGAGTIGSGDSRLTLKNLVGGTIDATGVLVLDTGNAVTNAGLLEATAGGTLDVQDATITNTAASPLGIVVASGSFLEVDAAGGLLNLNGGGAFALNGGTIKGNGTTAEILQNINNTITGTGTIGNGDGLLTLKNQSGGTIDATGGTLTLETGNTIVNSGLLEATNSGILDLKDGIINNSGLVTTGATLGLLIDSTSKLLVDTTLLKLTGNGDVSLHGGEIAAQAAGLTTGQFVTLENVSDTIFGTGQIGDGTTTDLKLKNDTAGVIDATGGTLILDTGNTVTNAGLLEATNHGILDIKDATINNGGLVTTGSTLGILVDGTSTLLIDATTVQLTGSGDVSMLAGSLIAAPAAGGLDPTLENVNNTIFGAGTIGRNGDGQLTLKNDAHGVIDATGGTLTFDTGNTIGNSGLLEATNHGVLDIQDAIINNSGLVTTGGTLGILVDSTSELLVDTATLKLTGSGDVSLEGGQIAAQSTNALVTSGSFVTLENVNETITGYGQIGNAGDGSLTLKNDLHGMIDATGGTLTIDTGNNIVNNGVLQVEQGATLILDDKVTGSGSLQIAGNGLLELADAASSQMVTFLNASTGTLELTKAIATHTTYHFGPEIYGVTASNTIDLADLTYTNGAINGNISVQTSYTADDTIVTITNSATHQAVVLTVDGVISGWTTSYDGHGGVDLVDPSAASSSLSINSGSMLDLAASSTAAISFLNNAGTNGTLTLDNPTSFTGLIYGFTGDGTLAGSDLIDLKGIDYNSSSFTESFNATTDTLSVSDGTNTTVLHFVGTYQAENFSFASDGNGGTIVYDPPVGTETSSSSTSTPVVTAVNDTFVFGSTSGHETAADFHKGVDKIELDYFDPVSATGQAETFDQWAASGGIVHQGADTLVVLDPNHPQQSATLLLKNVASLSANDFIIHPGAHTA